MLNRLVWLWDRTVETLRYEGPRIMLLRAGRVVLSPIGELLVFSYHRIDLTQPIPRRDARIQVEIAPLTIGEIDEVVPVIWDSYHPARRRLDGGPGAVKSMVRARYATGATCFVARRSGSIVHYNWVFEQQFEGVEATIDLSPIEAHCDNGFTTEDSRGQGVHAAVNCRMLQFLRDRGNEIAYTRVTVDNLSSQKALQQVGWQPFAQIAAFMPRWSDRVFTKTIQGPLGPIKPKRTAASKVS